MSNSRGNVSGVLDVVFLRLFGGPGTQDGKFLLISGIAVSEGKVYVGDAVLSRVQVFTTDGEFLYSFGSGVNLAETTSSQSEMARNVNASEEELNSPVAITALNANLLFRTADIAVFQDEVFVLNNLYSEPNRDKARLVPSIMRFTMTGIPLGRIKIPALFPISFDIDEEGVTVISDTLNNCFFTVDVFSEEILFTSNIRHKSNYIYFLEKVFSEPTMERRQRAYLDWTSAGGGQNQFDAISGVTFFRDKILTVDRGNKRIKIYSRDGEVLKIINARIGETPIPVFDDPIDIAVMKDGVVFLVDASPNKPEVIAFSPRFTPLFSLRHVEMRQPNQIAISENDEIFVTDISSQKIFVFGARPSVRKTREAIDSNVESGVIKGDMPSDK